MIRLALIIRDPKYRGPLNRDLVRDRLTFTDHTFREIADYIDYPPLGTALREAFDGPLNQHTIGVAQIVHAIEVGIWNMRGLKIGPGDWGPFPQIRIPGVEAESEPTADWSQLDDSTDMSDFASPAALAILRG